MHYQRQCTSHRVHAFCPRTTNHVGYHRLPSKFCERMQTSEVLCRKAELARSESIGDRVDRLLSTVPRGNAKNNLEAADKFWHKLCNAEPIPVQEVLTESKKQVQIPSQAESFDVVVLGGTLGIFLATALLLKGKKVAVVERLQLKGREQEWNISRADMKTEALSTATQYKALTDSIPIQAFVDEGILTSDELEEVISSEFNPVRVGFQGVSEVYTENVLNCGVSPKLMIDKLKARFLQNGGILMENTTFQKASIHQNSAQIFLELPNNSTRESEAGGAGSEGGQRDPDTYHQNIPGKSKEVYTEILIDAMGSFSPIANQSRKGAPPDSVVLMVGSCAQGLPQKTSADLLYSFTPINKKRRLQYFWESFPAKDGLTTYMFCYADPAPGRASLRNLYEDYIELLPEYMGCEADLKNVRFERAQFGVVPNWHSSPPNPCTSRLLHVGDAAGNRSALSFAGFGAMARHLVRLRRAIIEALDLNLLEQNSLQLLQPKSPAISLTAAMQYTMGTRTDQNLENCDIHIINNYIGESFEAMKDFGPSVFRPFMQDYLQWSSLLRIVGRQLVTNPKIILDMTLFMRSPKAGQMFVTNLTLLALYDSLFRIAQIVNPIHEALLGPNLKYRWRRLVRLSVFS